MRRQLVVTVVATSSLILIALLLPMAALVERFAAEDALAAAGLEVQATESVVAFRERADLVSFIQDINQDNAERRTTVLFTDGDAIGPDPESTPDVLRARESGRAISNNTAEGIEVLVPVTVRGQQGDPQQFAVQPEVSVIRVVIDAATIGREVLVSWVVLALLGVGLLGFAVLVADRLGRTLVRPVTTLARTAERLGQGELTARAGPDGPKEIREVGLALNRLAARTLELLAAERESVADASHRLHADHGAAAGGRRAARRRRARPPDRRRRHRGQSRRCAHRGSPATDARGNRSIDRPRCHHCRAGPVLARPRRGPRP